MAIIGTFTKHANGFNGNIRTLTSTAFVVIETIQDKRSEKSPDYRLFVQSNGSGEVGAAWNRSRDGSENLSVRLDDPSFPAPIDCRLVKDRNGDGYSLIWERDRD